jgi:hypothetical protein
MFRLLNLIPFLGVALGGYVVALTMAGPDGFTEFLGTPAATFAMASSQEWAFSNGDFLLLGGLVALFIEIIKSTSSGAVSLINHALSTLVLVVAIVLLVTTPGYATSVFFLLTFMTLLDTVAGYTITIVTARRDIGF